jgi:hypothetical protein
VATHLLFNLKVVNNWGKLAQDFVGLLVVLQLSSDKIGKISERFWGIKDLK